MTSQSFINHSVPEVSPKDAVADVLELMQSTMQPELPLVEKGKLLGLIKESNLLQIPDDSVAVGSLPQTCEDCYVRNNVHFYDLLKKAAEFKSPIVPILNEENVYQGVVLMADVAQRMGLGLSLLMPGAVLVLNVNERDYSLAEIARLVESNDAKILNCYIETNPGDPLQVRVNMRINKPDLTRIIATFERFGYTIHARYHESDSPDVDQERWDSLMKYLDI